MKFRIWDKISKKMYYNGELEDGTLVMLGLDGTLYFDDDGSYKDSDFIIMQSLGLYDKNGKEIFDCDLLDFDEDEWGCKFQPELIRYKDVLGEWNLGGTKEDLHFRVVVGNIYEKESDE